MKRTAIAVGILLALGACSQTPEVVSVVPRTSQVGFDASQMYAHQVTKAFRDAGFKLGAERDNSDNCKLFGCTQFITTDLVTVLSFATPEAGWEYTRSIEPNGYQAGSIALSYLGQRTPEADRKKLEEVLRRFVR